MGQQHDGLGRLQTNVADGVERLENLQFQAKDGRVGQLQHLGRYRRVLRDQIGDLFDGARRRAHFFHHLEISLRRAGDMVHLGDQPLHRLARQPGLLRECLVERVQQRRRPARLDQMMMGVPDALHRALDVRQVGEHNAHRFGLPFHQGIQQLRAAHAGQPHIGHHRVKTRLIAERQRLLAR